MATGGSLPSILLIEDDDGDALLVRACLDESGPTASELVWTRTLAEGIAALRDGPHCVLLDLGLPDALGLAALERLVEEAPDTPVIVLTGRYDHTGTDALAAGAQDYVVKDDLTGSLLDRCIRYAVERKRAQRTTQQLRETRLSFAERSRLERGLLPTPLLRSDLVHCSTYYQPGRDHAVLGGDFFDVVETADGNVRAVIGDVMGHGPDEAALGVHLRVAWRTLVLAGTPDTQILPILAALLKAETGGGSGFVTACDVTIDRDLFATVRVAGHPAPLLCADGKTVYPDVEVGPPLGLEDLRARGRKWPDTGGWPQTRVSVGPGSSLILYTDGLLDAYAAHHDPRSLGLDEFVGAVDACVAGGEAVSSWIRSLVDTAPQQSIDDTAVVVLTTRTAAGR
jgi:serine phosphatase RsbU (regulator of sigma subunit)